MTAQSEYDHSVRYFLGVDGGGTKTLAVIVDASGSEQGRGLAGSSNYNAVGLQEATANLQSAVEQAAQAAGCQMLLRAAWFGLAGIDRPADYEIMLPYLQPVAEAVRLTNDAELLLSGLDDAVGVALIAGTGSIALGCDARGTKTRSGGWGHILGDEGSGYEIGRMALQAAARAADGRGPPTILLERILAYWNLDMASDLIGRVYQDEDVAEIGRLSAVVFAAARAGDQAARQIIQHAASELALAVTTVCAALDFGGGRVPLALGGGLLIHEPGFRNQVLRRIQRRRAIGPVVIVEQPALSAARAAIRLSAANHWASTPTAGALPREGR
jgi:glucosamine kinase